MTEKKAIRRTLSARSRKNLIEALRDEAFAFAKYKLFAKHARENGNIELAILFDRTADQEYLEHFAQEADLLGLAGTDEQDLQHAIAGESIEVDRVYGQFAQEAREDGDVRVAERFEEIRHDEAVHRLAFEEALIRLQTHDRLTGKKRSNSQAS